VLINLRLNFNEGSILLDGNGPCFKLSVTYLSTFICIYLDFFENLKIQFLNLKNELYEVRATNIHSPVTPLGGLYERAGMLFWLVQSIPPFTALW
jgi:hypothetical protein